MNLTKSFVLLGLLLISGYACTIDDDCGGPDQAGVCVGGICQCGIGYSGDLLVDPTACSLTCSPPPVPDSIVFLKEPLIGLDALAGNLVLNVTLDPYSKQVPTTVAFNNPTDGTACAMMPAALGTGRWSQEIVNGPGCDTEMVYSRNFADEVAQGCWETLASQTESGAQYEVTFNSYATQVEVIQEGMAPFGQTARDVAARDETTITRRFRRDYTINVATQFKPSSAPFLVIAEGRIRYRLVLIDYDLLNNKIVVSVETETVANAKLGLTLVDASSNGISAVVGGPNVGACEANSPAGFCRQFHLVEFSSDPCQVASAELVLDVEFQCADGSDPSTCGFTNLPANNRYLLPNLLIDYDACPRVIEYGIDTANSFLRLHEDVQRAVPVTAPATTGSVLYGRCSIAPTANGEFQSVTLTSLKVYQVASPNNIDLGDQLSSTFMTLISNAVQNSPNNAIWDFDLLIDESFFQLTEQYFLEATLDLVFANTGPLTKRIVIPINNSRKRLSKNTVHLITARAGDATESEDGIKSSTFRLQKEEVTTEEEEEEVVSSSGGVAIIGVAAGVACVALIAALIVVVVVVRKRRKKEEEEEPQGQAQLSEITISTAASEPSQDSSIDGPASINHLL